MYVTISVYAGSHGDQTRVLDTLELELQVPVGCPTWVLEAISQSSKRAVKAINHRAISPATNTIVLNSLFYFRKKIADCLHKYKIVTKVRKKSTKRKLN